jgi:membrane protease YdiL (CAAX protease family)
MAWLLNSRLDFPHWMNGLESRIRALEDSAGKLTDLFLNSGSNADLAVNFLMIAILPAIGEEFLFRGVLQKLFISWTRNNHAGVILEAFIFSFLHFQFYGCPQASTGSVFRVSDGLEFFHPDCRSFD